MTVTVVLDGRGLHAWSRASPPRQVVAVMEVLRRSGSGRVIVPSVVTVEALTGGEDDDAVEQTLHSIDVETTLDLAAARRAAALRQGLEVSAADAVVAEAVLRHDADYVVTSDPEDLRSLLGPRTGRRPVIVAI